MKRTILFLLVAILLMLCCFGCGTVNTDDDLPVDTSVDVASLLSVDEVKNATGIKVLEPQVSAEGAAGYFSEDMLSVIYVAAQQGTKEDFETMKQNLAAAGTLTEAPNLGEMAVWCEQSCALIVYADGKLLDVCVQYAEFNPNDSLLATRQLAALLIEKM